MESKMNTYTIDVIDDDCFDLYVSDDDGYTWEYYATYEDYATAVNEGEAAVMIGVDTNV
jgi:hypothetical protein